MITATLRHFALTELSHPELIANDCAVWLDDIRDLCGFPLTVTSAARTPEENAALPGSSPTSLHLSGRAFDLAWIDDPAERWRFVEAVSLASGERAVELEFVPFGNNRHLHIALHANDGHHSTLLFSEA